MNLKLNILPLFLMLLVLPVYVAGQGVNISSGIYMKMLGGTLVLHGNWVNNGNYADTLGTVILNDTAKQDIGGSNATQFSNITINNIEGVVGSHDFTVKGILNLESANASDTVGTLDMAANILTMDSSATTVGVGDVTGIVKRTTFVAYTAYSFGNSFATVSFNPGGTYPSQILVQIKIGKSPPWKTTAIKRVYDLIQTGASDCLATVTVNYLDTELNGNDEDNLVLWANGISGIIMGLNEFGRANHNSTENWVSITNIHIGYFPSSFGQLEITLANSEVPNYTWNGSQSTVWTIIQNWTPNGAPSNISGVIIPDTSFTQYSPTLPDSAEVKTLTIETLGILNSGTNSKFSVYGNSGAWNDQGTFNSSAGNVIFKGDLATISGTTNFYDITIDSAASLRVTTGNIMRIAGTLTNNGVFHTVIGDPTTVEYNGGDQTVVIPNPASRRYSNLILSGNGTKTLPDSAMSVYGDLSVSGAATAVSGNDLTVRGNLDIGSGSEFNTGAFNHSIEGNITNKGTLTATGSTITCNGTLAQTIGGTAATTFNDLTSNNAVDVTLAGDALITVAGTLTINSGKKLSVAPGKQLTVDGIISNNAGASNFVLHSGAAGTASLLHNTDNVPAAVQRYISGTAEAWHFLSSPVAVQGFSASWLPPGTYGNGTGYDLYVWNEPNNCWIYKLNSTSVINWNTVHPESNFIPGRGYLYSTQAVNPTKTFAGNLNNGSLTYPLTVSSADVSLKGFNFVGNPYPSSVDWQASSGWTRSNLVSSGSGYDMWIWNPAANNYGVCNSATGTGTNNVTRNITSMQGFFVKAAVAGDLGMDNTVRLHEGTGNWFKESEINSGMISLVAESATDFSFDEIKLQFGYTSNQSGATKLFSQVLTAPSLFMPSGGENFSVRYLTDTEDIPTVQVMFKPGIDGNYTIRCKADVTEFETVMLEDLKTKKIHSLKENNTYNFQSSTSDDANRFVLHFGPENTTHYIELPARIYRDGNRVVIDLSKVSTESEMVVYDAVGRLLMQKTLQGLTEHELNINTSAQILLVKLNNKQGNISRKVFKSNHQ